MQNTYLMENSEEVLRLDMKTSPELVKRHASWAGISPGMKVADLGCGSGKTTYYLNKLVQPGGETIGVDFVDQRIDFAKEKYSDRGIRFLKLDIRNPLKELGELDFIWIRFVLEYYRENSFDLVKNASKMLKPGGVLCLIDSDYNCLTHFGLSDRLQRTIDAIVEVLEEEYNFDPFVGRKLYSFLYDLNYKDIKVDLSAHHLIYGTLNNVDAFNWMKKVSVIAQKLGFVFEDHYRGGINSFLKEFNEYFKNPRRFIYTPLIACSGLKSNHS